MQVGIIKSNMYIKIWSLVRKAYTEIIYPRFHIWPQPGISRTADGNSATLTTHTAATNTEPLATPPRKVPTNIMTLQNNTQGYPRHRLRMRSA